MNTLQNILKALLVALVAILGVTSMRLVGQPDGLLTVAFLDVGQGDSVYIETPNGFQMLVDGGGGAQVLAELGRVMPMFDRSLDYVAATHLDKDHIGGLLSVFETMSIRQVLDTGMLPEDTVDERYYETIDEYGIERQAIYRGDYIELDKEARVSIEIFSPDLEEMDTYSTNDKSLVMRLQYGDTSIMLTGDASQKIEKKLVLLGDDLDVDILKVGHHGSKTSSAGEFLDATTPELVIIQAGENNRYGHPHADVLSAFRSRDIEYLCNCTEGRIVMKSDGIIWWRE
ncbi:MAG: competence protein ComEC [Planctomycetota bacterium]|jgi:competence protein ComEC